MPRHWSLCFLVSPCYLQDTMPCQWSSSNLPRVLWIWESIFYLQAFFTSHSFLLVSRFPWEPAVQPQRQQDFPARLFVWITTIHKRSTLVASNQVLWLAGLRYEESVSYGIWTLFAIGEHARSLMLYPFAHRDIQSLIN